MHKMSTVKTVDTRESILAAYTDKCARIKSAGTTDNRVWHGAWKRARNQLEAIGMSRNDAIDAVDPIYKAARS